MALTAWEEVKGVIRLQKKIGLDVFIFTLLNQSSNTHTLNIDDNVSIIIYG